MRVGVCVHECWACVYLCMNECSKKYLPKAVRNETRSDARCLRNELVNHIAAPALIQSLKKMGKFSKYNVHEICIKTTATTTTKREWKNIHIIIDAVGMTENYKDRYMPDLSRSHKYAHYTKVLRTAYVIHRWVRIQGKCAVSARTQNIDSYARLHNEILL